MQITHVAKIIVNIKPGDSTLVINVTIKLSWAASTENTIAGYDARNPGQILLRNPTESSRLEIGIRRQSYETKTRLVSTQQPFS